MFPRTRTGFGRRKGGASGGSGRVRGQTRARARRSWRSRAAALGVVGRHVEDEKDAVGVVREVREVRLGVALGDGGRVDELHLHVLELHHPGQRRARRERVLADLGVRVREGREERRLAGVRRPEEDPLAGSLAPDVADLDPVPRPPRGGCAASSSSFERRLRRSASIFSVPLCFGRSAIISRSAASFSAWSVARLKRSSASWYCGVRFAVTPSIMVRRTLRDAARRERGSFLY